MWDGRGYPAFDADSSPDESGPEEKGEMAGDNVKGGDYQMAGRMALSARRGKQGSCSLLTSKTSTTYNFLWTRFTFSEGAADGFGVVCKA